MDRDQAERRNAAMIRETLMQRWDPIGVRDVPEAADEYDAYIWPVRRILESSCAEEELVDFLWEAETETMGLTGSTRAALYEVARSLLALKLV